MNIYGPYDLETPEGKSAGVVRDFLGKNSYQEAPELWKRVSPATYLDENDPPTLIIHGTIDEVVPVEQPTDSRNAWEISKSPSATSGSMAGPTRWMPPCP